MRNFIIGLILGFIIGTLALIYNARIYEEDGVFLLEYMGQVWEYEEV